MKGTFKSYLNQQAAENKYSRSPSEEILSEKLFGDNKKYQCYGVTINFGDKEVADIMTKSLINALESGSTTAAAAAKTLADRGAEGFKKDLRDKVAKLIFDMIFACRRISKELIFKDAGSALAAINQSGNTELEFVFFKGPRTNPKAYAERFIDSVKRDPEIALISKKLDIVPETYYKNDIVEDRKESVLYKLFMSKTPNFDEMIADIDKYKIVDSTVAELSGKVEKQLREIYEKSERGSLVSVYMVPLKIDDELIREIVNSDKIHNIDECYTAIAKKINNELGDALKQVAKIDDYIGFIPTKTYGLNLYFKDKDTAEDLAEKLNQTGPDGAKERKKYDKKLSQHYQLLGKVDGLDLKYPGDGSDDSMTEFFKNTLFARAHVIKLIKEKYKDVLELYRFSATIKSDFITAISKEDNRAAVSSFIDKVINAAKTSDNFEGISIPDKSTINFYSRNVESCKFIKEKISNLENLTRFFEFNDGAPERVKFTSSDISKIKELCNPSNLIALFADKYEEKLGFITKELTLKLVPEKLFTNCGVGSLLAGAKFIGSFSEIEIKTATEPESTETEPTRTEGEPTTESFKNAFKSSLLRSINMLNETRAGASAANPLGEEVIKNIVEIINEKGGIKFTGKKFEKLNKITVDKFINNYITDEDKKQRAKAGLIQIYYNVWDKVVSIAAKRAKENEFKWERNENTLVIKASERASQEFIKFISVYTNNIIQNTTEFEGKLTEHLVFQDIKK